MAEWTPSMKETHTILAPQMSPIHFRLFEPVIRSAGYKFRVIPTVTEAALEKGQRSVNNDACYPAIVTIGQLVDAIDSFTGEDGNPSDHVAGLITQTGGGCRASQYYALLKKAMHDNGKEHIPLIPLALAPIAGQPFNPLGFKLRHVEKIVYAAILGDCVMTLLHKVRPYEEFPGHTDQVTDILLEYLCTELSSKMGYGEFKRSVSKIVETFSQIPTSALLNSKPKIGIVGEILLKYHPDANNHLVDFIEESGCEAVVSPIIDFFLYCFSGPEFQHELLARSRINAKLMHLLIWLVEACKRTTSRIISQAFHGVHWPSIYELSELVGGIISRANSMGEGWLLPAEIVDLVTHDCPHVIVAQPFGCLPNHCIALGTIDPISSRYPSADILPLNYDSSASSTNHQNRLEGLIESAFAHFTK